MGMNRLKEIREANLLTQEDLGSLVGAHYTTIYRIEAGKQRPHFSLIKKLAKALKVRPEELHLRGDGNAKQGD